MKTFKKVCMILISVTAVAGIGCIIAAFVMGADPRQIRNYTEGKTSGKLQTEERNIRADQIRKLNIDIGSGNVKLQNGNQDHLIIKKKGSWEPVILKSDGEIEIKQKSRHFKLFWFQSNDEITVILPKGVTFEKVSMDCGNGDIASDSLNLTTITTSKTEIDLGSGDVTLTMAGTEKDYNYNIDCGNGDVKIGDILFEDDLKKRNINALRWINIDCGSGDLTIDFDNTIL